MPGRTASQGSPWSCWTRACASSARPPRARTARSRSPASRVEAPTTRRASATRPECSPTTTGRPRRQARQRAVSNVAGNVDRRHRAQLRLPRLARIGDTIYFDVNGNGTQDAGDNGIAGLVVYLYRDDGDGVFDAGDPVVGSLTTDANGQYLFAGLTNALYFVSVPPITNYTFRGPAQTAMATPRTGSRRGRPSQARRNVLTVDFGFQPNVTAFARGLRLLRRQQQRDARRRRVGHRGRDRGRSLGDDRRRHSDHGRRRLLLRWRASRRTATPFA